MSDYAKHCPLGGGVENFARMTEAVIASFNDSDAPLPPRKIRRELERVQSAIKSLSPETRSVIGSREIGHWQTARLQGTYFDDEYFKRSDLMQNGGSALDLLEDLVGEDYKSKTQRDAIKRRDLIAGAAFIFSVQGGEIEAGLNSPFVEYVQHLFIDVSMEEADCSKAIRDFLAKNEGVFD